MEERKTIFKCDLCGKEVRSWYEIIVIPTGLQNSKNVSHMMEKECRKDICEDCFRKIKNKFEEMIP